MLRSPPAYRARYDHPSMGIAGTRASTSVEGRPLFGTIIKPNIGLSPAEIAALVGRLCEAGADFIKDDEIAGTHPYAPVPERIRAVMNVVRRHRDKTGKLVMVAFNITDETDAMRRHADLLAREEGSCAMVSLNWVGMSAVQTLRRHTELAIHGHRNGYGGLGAASAARDGRAGLSNPLPSGGHRPHACAWNGREILRPRRGGHRGCAPLPDPRWHGR